MAKNLVWAKLKGLPRQMYWPGEVVGEDGEILKIFIKSDDEM